jgi:aminomethyltransferase
MTPVFIGKQPSFALLARTGYTGEDGFEIFVAKDAARALWQQLLDAGAKPCGLGCRDTLRLEACMPLHGHEINDDITPLEAGLGWAIAGDHDFIGKPAVLRQKTDGVKKHLVACTVATGIPRAGCFLRVGGTDVGSVVSGTYSPTLKTGIALGFSNQLLAVGAAIDVIIHGQPRPAVVVQRPFYKRPG